MNRDLTCAPIVHCMTQSSTDRAHLHHRSQPSSMQACGRNARIPDPAGLSWHMQDPAEHAMLQWLYRNHNVCPAYRSNARPGIFRNPSQTARSSESLPAHATSLCLHECLQRKHAQAGELKAGEWKGLSPIRMQGCLGSCVPAAVPPHGQPRSRLGHGGGQGPWRSLHRAPGCSGLRHAAHVCAEPRGPAGLQERSVPGTPHLLLITLVCGTRV